MRTTIEIDDDLLQVAKSISREQCLSLGEVISPLLAEVLASQVEAKHVTRNGFSLFKHPLDPTAPVNLNQLLDELDEA